jgi:hypothetical protein
MTDEKLSAAMVEAERFLSKAEAFRKEPDYVVGTKRSGALRRASMDLTRALAELRKYE